MKFDVFLMDMFQNEEGAWEENNRFHVGCISVPAISVDDVTDKMLLDAMFSLKMRNISGLTAPAINTTDRRKVYAEDYYGDGSWFEVGAVKGHEPIYGLKPIYGAILRFE